MNCKNDCSYRVRSSVPAIAVAAVGLLVAQGCVGDDLQVSSAQHGLTTSAMPIVMDSMFPADNAVDVPINAYLSIDFNVPIAITEWTGGGALYRGDGTLVESFTFERRNIVDRHNAMVELSSLLEPNTDYYVTLDTDAVNIQQAPWGHLGSYTTPPDAELDSTVWNFTTGTAVDPTLFNPIPEGVLPSVVSSVFPADDDIYVPINAPLIMHTNADVAVDEYTTYMAIHRSDDDSLVEHIVLERKNLLDARTVVVDLTDDLEPYTSYYVTIHASAVRVAEAPWGYIGSYTPYYDNNSFLPDMWNFSTGAFTDPQYDHPIPESEQPSIVASVSPTDDAVGVPLDTQLVINLDVPVIVDAYSSYMELRLVADGSLVETFPMVPAVLTDPHTVTLQPSAELLPDTEYYVTIAGRALTLDVAPYDHIGSYIDSFDGNMFSSDAWNFKTENPVEIDDDPATLTYFRAEHSPWQVDIDTEENLIIAYHDDGPVLVIDYDGPEDDGHRAGISPDLGCGPMEGNFFGAQTSLLYPILHYRRHHIEDVAVRARHDRLEVRMAGGSYTMLDPDAEDKPLFMDATFTAEAGTLGAHLSGLYYLLPSKSPGTTLDIGTATGSVVTRTITMSSPQQVEYIDDVRTIAVTDGEYGAYSLTTDLERLQVEVRPLPILTVFELDFDHAFKDLGQEVVTTDIAFGAP
ncbi:MAG: Ig-like domain-containing protein, partial [Myxococcota bacterium]